LSISNVGEYIGSHQQTCRRWPIWPDRDALFEPDIGSGRLRLIAGAFFLGQIHIATFYHGQPYAIPVFAPIERLGFCRTGGYSRPMDGMGGNLGKRR
jgi:hypothetical protein